MNVIPTLAITLYGVISIVVMCVLTIRDLKNREEPLCVIFFFSILTGLFWPIMLIAYIAFNTAAHNIPPWHKYDL